VVRDKFYDGHNIMEPCTVITRIAPTFIRFGSFEIIKPGGPSAGKTEIATKTPFFRFPRNSRTSGTRYPTIFGEEYFFN